MPACKTTTPFLLSLPDGAPLGWHAGCGALRLDVRATGHVAVCNDCAKVWRVVGLKAVLEAAR